MNWDQWLQQEFDEAVRLSEAGWARMAARKKARAVISAPHNYWLGKFRYLLAIDGVPPDDETVREVVECYVAGAIGVLAGINDSEIEEDDGLEGDTYP